MELGGAYGVRAYPEGEAYGDQGYIATLEARLMLSHWAPSFPGQLQLIGFVDVGEVEYAHDPWFTGSNHAGRSGIGAGLTWAGPHDFIVKASYATKLGDAKVTSGPDSSGRAWFQISKLF
jgi:hemolysin activation/secretion protein